jgi:ABC-type nitrate/sulfonate/bicarbonate transport system substrate-binding protein
MSTLAEAVESLSPEEQQAVLAFIEYLREGNPANVPPEQPSPFAGAAEEFIRQHPELLRRLAQ